MRERRELALYSCSNHMLHGQVYIYMYETELCTEKGNTRYELLSKALIPSVWTTDHLVCVFHNYKLPSDS